MLMCVIARESFLRMNMYDNTLEYWVVVKERGTQKESRQLEERRRTVEKAQLPIVFGMSLRRAWMGR